MWRTLLRRATIGIVSWDAPDDLTDESWEAEEKARAEALVRALDEVEQEEKSRSQALARELEEQDPGPASSS